LKSSIFEGKEAKRSFFVSFQVMAGRAIFLARPTLSTNSLTSSAPLTASIEPVVLFSILDHALRRNANQKRVIGTMLGIRSDDGTEVEIRNCFAVPHNESSEQVLSSSQSTT
jgi:translation initiation factor 3 subunit F